MSKIEKETAEKKIDAQIAELTRAMANPDLAQGTASEFSRVSGYYRAAKYVNNYTGKMDSSFNTGKNQEFKERKMYKV